MMATVILERREPTPWAASAPATEFRATVELGPDALPDGLDVVLVSFGEQPHWVPGFKVRVWAILTGGVGRPWRVVGHRGEGAEFGASNALDWYRTRVDRAWARARHHEAAE